MTITNTQQRLLDEFFELVKIDSPTLHEDKIATVLKQKLKELGFTISEDNVGEVLKGKANNIFAFREADKGKNGSTLLFSAHMDCVSPCIGVEPQFKDGIITSKGETVLGADDKSGVVSILEALRRLKEENIPTNAIQVVFTVAEEGGLNGSKHITKDMLKADFGYVLDSGGLPGSIIYSAPGVNNIHAIMHGKTAHAGVAPELGINAVVVLSKALAYIPQGRLDEETTANVGSVTGGGATNIVPDFAEMTMEMRSRDKEKLENVTQKAIDTLKKAAEENGATVDITVTNKYPSYKFPFDAQVIQLAKKAAEEVGLKVTIDSTGGGSDATHFNRLGVPSIPLGTGMKYVHTQNEQISLEDLESTVKLIMSIIKNS